MGYSTRNNGLIEDFTPDDSENEFYILGKDFTPDDSENEFYILGSASIEEIVVRAAQHFGADTKVDDITIRGETIHTRCLTYDLYDSADYDDYLIISKNS